MQGVFQVEPGHHELILLGEFVMMAAILRNSGRKVYEVDGVDYAELVRGDLMSPVPKLEVERRRFGNLQYAEVSPCRMDVSGTDVEAVPDLDFEGIEPGLYGSVETALIKVCRRNVFLESEIYPGICAGFYNVPELGFSKRVKTGFGNRV